MAPYIPTELVLDILLRLPWTSLRRARLVCRSWRDLVHDRTTEMQQRRDAVPLVVTTESVYVLDDDEASGPPRELWPADTGPYKHMAAVGACNGVLCLCDDAKPGGAITLVNPATGDALALPRIRCAGLFRRHNTRQCGTSWHHAYSFGYHHRTGRYTVVHVPCFLKTKETLHVFTLGEASWREVPAPGAKSKLDAGLVSVNGVTYWVTEASTEKIMSLDHRNDHMRFTKPLPVSGRRPICQLTQVHRKLSAAICDQIDGDASIEVWVLEITGNEQVQTWTHVYSLRYSSSPWPSIKLSHPNFIYSRYALMVGALRGQGQELFGWRRNATNYVTPSKCMVHGFNNKYSFEKPLVSDIKGDICRTLAYIKTTEALSVYRRW